jgi:hypothetical protein
LLEAVASLFKGGLDVQMWMASFTLHLGQILESEILVLCDSVLQVLSTNMFDIIIQ